MRSTILALAFLALVPVSLVNAKDTSKGDTKAAEKRAKIDTMAKETLDKLLAASPDAKKLFEKAAGYAVFDNTKFALGISGGGGHGVAVDKKTGARTYMRMGTVGVGLGLGGQSYNVIFLFENQKALQEFTDHGWQADTSASAAAGKSGANAEATFTDGVAYYMMTEKGLMAHAEIAGTKYSKNDKLN